MSGTAFTAAEYDHSPLDVVAWHGSHAPYLCDLADFNAFGTVGYDHPDPCLYTVLTAPSDTPGQANVDFVAFPPRWMVPEHTTTTVAVDLLPRKLDGSSPFMFETRWPPIVTEHAYDAAHRQRDYDTSWPS